AKKLFITQPSLSNAIRELENELNKTIFERTNRGISVTVDGAEFLGYARQVKFDIFNSSLLFILTITSFIILY
ncbi:transcriptional regulator, LysR family protein, partial [human gut metagenome]